MKFDLKIKGRYTLPLTEISGLALLNAGRMDAMLYAASDAKHSLWLQPMKYFSPSDDLFLLPEEGKKLKLEHSNTGDSQWEAIDIAGNEIYLLKESTGEIHNYTLDGKFKKARKVEGENVENAEALLWTNDGILVGFDGYPSSTIKEFTPKGPFLRALVKDSRISDFDRDVDGGFWVLLKDPLFIVHYSHLFSFATHLKLPQEIPHPEGLVAIGSTDFLVAADIKTNEPNLFWVGL